jgi:hypothetical protein
MTNEMFYSFHLLGRTYRTALQQMLKLYTILEDKHPPFLELFCAILGSVSGSMFAMRDNPNLITFNIEEF